MKYTLNFIRGQKMKISSGLLILMVLSNSAGAKSFEKCQNPANTMFADMGVNSALDGMQALLDAQGKLVKDPKKADGVLRHELAEGPSGVETFAYKARAMNFLGKTEIIERTIQIKRTNGQVTEMTKTLGQNAGPNTIQSQTNLYSYAANGDCSLEQSFNIMSASAGDKDLKTVVTFDQKACKSLEPALKALGSGGAQKCMQTIEAARVAFGERAKALAKEKKSFFFNPGAGVDANEAQMRSMIVRCSVADSPGTYVPYGPGTLVGAPGAVAGPKGNESGAVAR